MLENTRRKFFPAPSLTMEDIFFHLELIELSSYGMLEENVDTPFKTTTIMIGFLRLDIFLLAAKVQLLDISLLQLDGMDI